MKQRIPFVPEEDAIIRALYPNNTAKDVAALIDRSETAVYQRASRLGVEKSPEFLASEKSGRLVRGDTKGAATRFRKQQPGWNKGLKGVCGVHPNCRRTQFRKGERRGVAVKLYQPIGTQRISKDGYLERKIHDGMPLQSRWRAEHLLLWEEHLGPIPRGFAVTFKNGDRTDIRIDNLALTPRAELMRRNSYHTNYPKEIALAIQARGALTRVINKRTRDGRHQHAAQ